LVGWYLHLYDSNGSLDTIGQVCDVNGMTITIQTFSMEGIHMGTLAFDYVEGIRWRVFRDPAEWLYAAQVSQQNG
jgi:hypothetical protein